MKKLVCIVLAIVMTLALAACASAEFKFERKIDLVCPWGVGGGADSTLRPMAQLLQGILGVPVEVVNVEGGSGVNGVEYTYKQPADGYTFMLGTQSLYIQDMLGNTSMDFKTEFECEDVLVHSINAIVASKISLEKFGVSNWAELQAYIKDHPFEVSVAMLTATGVDGASLAQATEGLDLMEIPYSSGSDANSALVGGHCDLYVCGWDDISGLVESGDIVPDCWCSVREPHVHLRLTCQCSVENGIDSVMPVRGAASSRRRAPRRKRLTRWLPRSKKRSRATPGKNLPTMLLMTSVRFRLRAKRPLRSAIRSIRICTTTWSSRAPS